MGNRRTQLEAEIAEHEDVIKRFSFTASLGNPDAFRTVHNAHERIATAEAELAKLEAGQNGE